MSDRETAELHVETAPFPQTITKPCCGKEATRLILDERTASTSFRDCRTKIEYIHNRRRGDGKEDSTEQAEPITDGGRETAETRRCRRCGVPHHEHPDANQSGGVGQLLPWDDDLCPICLDKRRELASRAAWRYLEALLAGEILQPTGPEQATLGEVTPDA